MDALNHAITQRNLAAEIHENACTTGADSDTIVRTYDQWIKWAEEVQHQRRKSKQ